MSGDLSIDIEHVTRVEGHGNIVLNVKNGNIENIQWQVPEAPRFFESMLKGRYYYEIQSVVSRICGICSIGHSLASLKAIEDAFGIKISEQTGLLRRLAINAENIQSHILHIGYLVLPDLVHAGSVFQLVNSKYKSTLLKIVKLHRIANEMSDLICGRTTHPIRLIVGSFTVVPSEKELIELNKKLKEALEITEELAETMKKLAENFPRFERETEYIALTSDKEYALYDGYITSTDTGRLLDYKNYRSFINEYVVPHSTAKYAKHVRESYMVGALARFNLNSKFLHKFAKEISSLFDLKPICYNPFMNNIAQLVEIAHCIEDSMIIIDKLLSDGIKQERIKIKPKAGTGVGIVEVPRGLLVHEYTLNEEGICTKANCIIPTNQNHANIQKDMEEFVPKIIEKPKEEIELNLEMLVRAYDPCISCSTHFLKIKFV